MKVAGIFIGLILWPLFLARAIIEATKIAFTIRQYTRCEGCGRAALKENTIFGYCSIECAAENNDAVEDVTEEIHNQADWVTLQNDKYVQRNFDVFLDQNGFIYLQDFSDVDNVMLKPVGHDGISL